MPLTPYVRPQDTITQILQQVAAREESRRNPVVIGPEYKLFLVDGRTFADDAKVDFAAAGAIDNSYTDTNGVALNLTNYTPLQAEAVLYGENLRAQVADFSTGGLWEVDLTDTSLRTLTHVGAGTIAGSGTLSTVLDGRPIQVGDVLAIETTRNTVTTTITRTVVSLVAGDVSGEYIGVVVNGPVVELQDHAADPVNTVDSVTVSLLYSGPLDDTNVAAGSPLTTTAADWDYAASIGIDPEDAGLDTPGALIGFDDAVGKLILSYKALRIPATTEGVIELESVTAIESALGETDQENWLARGALEAFKGNQNQVVYALRTGGDTVTDFETALNKISTTDNVYALAPMTDDEDVMVAVKDHCELMSNKYNKNFRRAYVGTDSPGTYVHWGQLEDTTYRTASLASSILTLSTAFQEDWEFTSDDVGASVTVGATTATILSVIDGTSVVTDALVSATETDANLTVTRPDTALATAAYVKDRSALLSSRRISNIWIDNPTVDNGSGGTEILQAKFVAAEIAGLRCALLPQQGLTLTEILSVDAAPGMYTRFSPTILDDIASYGTMIVTQESEGGDIFIRHQLTTETEQGALAYEDNVGVIVDEFSYAVKDEFRAYIGRRNATPDTIAEIDDKLRGLAEDFTQAELVNRFIGPQVLTFFDENGSEGEVTVRQDGNLADTLLTYVKLRVPLPLNGINHYIDVDVTEVLASADNVA